MDSKKIIALKYVISSVIFLAICLFGSLTDAALRSKSKKDSTLSLSSSLPFLKLVAVENDTDSCEFQIFYGSDASSAFVFPKSTFSFNAEQSLPLHLNQMLVIKCSKGAYLPVFVQHGNAASGVAPENFDGPFYLSMWLAYPQVPETNKVHIRYAVKKNAVGTVGIKIGSKGDYRFVAYDNVQFIA